MEQSHFPRTVGARVNQHWCVGWWALCCHGGVEQWAGGQGLPSKRVIDTNLDENDMGMIKVEEVVVVQTGLPWWHVALYVSLWLLRGVINGDLDHISKDRVLSRAWMTRWPW